VRTRIALLQRLFAKRAMDAQSALVSHPDMLLSLVILSINVSAGIPACRALRPSEISISRTFFN